MVLNFFYLNICSMFLAYFFWHFNFVNINSYIGKEIFVFLFVLFIPFLIGISEPLAFPYETGLYCQFVLFYNPCEVVQ